MARKKKEVEELQDSLPEETVETLPIQESTEVFPGVVVPEPEMATPQTFEKVFIESIGLEVTTLKQRDVTIQGKNYKEVLTTEGVTYLV